MTNYKQLGQEQRYVIGRLIRQGKSKNEIADVLGYHKSTIGRELKRNTPKRGRGAKEYNPQRAQLKTLLYSYIGYNKIRFSSKLKNDRPLTQADVA